MRGTAPKYGAPRRRSIRLSERDRRRAAHVSVVREQRLELRFPGPEPGVLPLDDSRVVGRVGIEPTFLQIKSLLQYQRLLPTRRLGVGSAFQSLLSKEFTHRGRRLRRPRDEFEHATHARFCQNDSHGGSGRTRTLVQVVYSHGNTLEHSQKESHRGFPGWLLLGSMGLRSLSRSLRVIKGLGQRRNGVGTFPGIDAGALLGAIHAKRTRPHRQASASRCG